MNKAYLLMGGNIGNRQQTLENARLLLVANGGEIANQSALYETAAWGKADQPSFLNQVLLLYTPLLAHSLMEQLLAIEKQMGRLRLEKYGARKIDIDILFFNEDIINSTQLTIPHPALPNRRFALQPLQEIAPHYRHPILQQTVTQLLNNCTDKLSVKKYL